MSAPIDDVSSLPGKKVSDQEENPIGEIKDIYAIDGDGHPMYVSVEASFGMGNKRTVFIPLARLKDENGELRVPYSKGHVSNTPEIDTSDGISPECDRLLRDHYGIDRADQELRSDHNSYATLVPEDSDGTPQRVDDPEQLETPSADKRDEETKKRLHDPGSSSTRDVDAGKLADENAEESGGDSGDEDTADDETGEDETPHRRDSDADD